MPTSRLLLLRVLEPLHRGFESLFLSAVTGVAKKRAVLRAPGAFLRAMVAHTNEVAMGAGGFLIDAANARHRAGSALALGGGLLGRLGRRFRRSFRRRLGGA